jgi:hypothetical protein
VIEQAEGLRLAVFQYMKILLSQSWNKFGKPTLPPISAFSRHAFTDHRFRSYSIS